MIVCHARGGTRGQFGARVDARIMRRAVEVPPLVTVVAILAGGALLGVIGALVTIPVTAALLLAYEQVVVPRQHSLWLAANSPERGREGRR